MYTLKVFKKKFKQQKSLKNNLKFKNLIMDHFDESSNSSQVSSCSTTSSSKTSRKTQDCLLLKTLNSLEEYENRLQQGKREAEEAQRLSQKHLLQMAFIH